MMATSQKLFFLLLMLLPTQLGFHFWPEWTLVLGRRVDYLSPTVYLTDVLVILLLVSWFFEAYKKFFPRSGIWLSQTFFKLTLILLFIGLNIFVAANKLEATYKWVKVLEFAALGWYIVKTKPSLSRIVYPLSIGVLYSSVIAIVQFIFQHSIGGPLWFLGERTFSVDTPGIARISWCLIAGSWCRELLRPYATFPHPNVLGGFLAATLPLLIFNFQFEIFNQTKKFSIFMLTTIILAMVVLILTFSRSAWIVGALGLLLAVRSLRPAKKKILSFTFVGVACLLFWFAFVAFKNITVDNESVVVRQQLNQAATMMWQQFPLVGVGLGNFLIRLPEVLPTRQIYFLQPAHNIYLLILAESGLVGLLLFGWLVFVAMRKYESRIMNYGKDKKSKLFMICTSLFIILLLGLVDHYPITLQQGQLLLTILLGLSATMAQ